MRYKKDAVQRLDVLWNEFFYSKTPEEQAEILRLSKVEFVARKTGKKALPSQESPKRVQVRSKWKLNTQAATNKPVLPGGVASPTMGNSIPSVIWVRELISKFDVDSACPIAHRKSAL